MYSYRTAQIELDLTSRIEKAYRKYRYNLKDEVVRFLKLIRGNLNSGDIFDDSIPQRVLFWQVKEFLSIRTLDEPDPNILINPSKPNPTLEKRKRTLIDYYENSFEVALLAVLVDIHSLEIVSSSMVKYNYIAAIACLINFQNDKFTKQKANIQDTRQREREQEVNAPFYQEPLPMCRLIEYIGDEDIVRELMNDKGLREGSLRMNIENIKYLHLDEEDNDTLALAAKIYGVEALFYMKSNRIQNIETNIVIRALESEKVPSIMVNGCHGSGRSKRARILDREDGDGVKVCRDKILGSQTKLREKIQLCKEFFTEKAIVLKAVEKWGVSVIAQIDDKSLLDRDIIIKALEREQNFCFKREVDPREKLMPNFWTSQEGHSEDIPHIFYCDVDVIKILLRLESEESFDKFNIETVVESENILNIIFTDHVKIKIRNNQENTIPSQEQQTTSSSSAQLSNLIESVIPRPILNHPSVLKYLVVNHTRLNNGQTLLETFLEWSKLTDDFDTMSDIIQLEPKYITYVNWNLRNTEEFMKAAAIKDPSTFNHASKRLQNDFNFVSELMEIPSAVEAFQYVDKRLRKSTQLMRKAIETKPTMLNYAQKEMKEDEEIVHNAVLKDPSSFQYASSKLRKNKDFILPLLKNNVYPYAAAEIKGNFFIACEQIKLNGFASLPYKLEKNYYFRFWAVHMCHIKLHSYNVKRYIASHRRLVVSWRGYGDNDAEARKACHAILTEQEKAIGNLVNNKQFMSNCAKRFGSYIFHYCRDKYLSDEDFTIHVLSFPFFIPCQGMTISDANRALYLQTCKNKISTIETFVTGRYHSQTNRQEKYIEREKYLYFLIQASASKVNAKGDTERGISLAAKACFTLDIARAVSSFLGLHTYKDVRHASNYGNMRLRNQKLLPLRDDPCHHVRNETSPLLEAAYYCKECNNYPMHFGNMVKEEDDINGEEPPRKRQKADTSC